VPGLVALRITQANRLIRRQVQTPGGYTVKRRDLSGGRHRLVILTNEGKLKASIEMTDKQWKELIE
jgi:hypothetical protein